GRRRATTKSSPCEPKRADCMVASACLPPPGETIATDGRRPAVEHLVEVDNLRRVCHLPFLIARQRLAHQVLAVNGLVDLVDGAHVESAHNTKHSPPVGRSGEEPRGGNSPPIVSPAADDQAKPVPSAYFPDSNRRVIAS